MRPATILAATLALVPSALAGGKKSAIVWFEDNVSDDFVKKAKDAIEGAGGVITHTYEIIKGFSALAPEEAFTDVRVQFDDKEHPMMHIEDDEEVGTFKQL